MRDPIFKVDTFTDRPFSGNPAGVCLLHSKRPASWMQAIAREMNVSETAFLLKRKDKSYTLRWFTPTTEVKLCGHATLASSHILWETGSLRENEEARFHTLSGLLIAKKEGDWIELDFPAKAETRTTPSKGLLQALRVRAKYVGRNDSDYLVEVESERIVRNIAPNFALLGKISTRGVIVTAKSSSKKYDFVSRFFAPAVGIDEDPVTGSAHSCLGPYWQRKLGRGEFVAYQASSRGGLLKLRVANGRVYIGGQAVTVLRGYLV